MIPNVYISRTYFGINNYEYQIFVAKDKVTEDAAYVLNGLSTMKTITIETDTHFGWSFQGGESIGTAMFYVFKAYNSDSDSRSAMNMFPSLMGFGEPDEESNNVFMGFLFG